MCTSPSLPLHSTLQYITLPSLAESTLPYKSIPVEWFWLMIQPYQHMHTHINIVYTCIKVMHYGRIEAISLYLSTVTSESSSYPVYVENQLCFVYPYI